MRLVSSNNQIPESDKFSSPSEFTPIDSAVIGHQHQPLQYSPHISQEPRGVSGTLKVPKETTPIDVAVFRMPLENDKKVNNIGSHLQANQILTEKGKASQQSQKVYYIFWLDLIELKFKLCFVDFGNS